MSIPSIHPPELGVNLYQSQEKSDRVLSPTLWVTDAETATSLEFFQIATPADNPTELAKSKHHILCFNAGTVEHLFHQKALALLDAGCRVDVMPLQNHLSDFIFGVGRDAAPMLLTSAISYENWVKGLEDSPLDLEPVLELAKFWKTSALPKLQISVKLEVLRKRAKVSSYDWNQFISQLEEQIHAAVDGQTDEDKPKSKKNPPADAIAREIAQEYEQQLAWNNETHTWMRYEADAPGVWSTESDAYVEHRVGVILDNKGVVGYGSYSYITNIVKHLGRLLFKRSWTEASPKEFLPFENGVLELATGQLLPHSPDYRFTWSLPRQHNPLAADWDTINRWMDEATGNKPQLKKILLCWLNACLKGRSDLQIFLHLTGPGGTGKGTFTRLTTALIGERNIHSSTLTDWNTNRFESANGYMKRLISFPDEDKYAGNLGNFKRLTGGDNLRGENKGQKAFQYQYDGMVMVASNYPIFASDTSSGMARRTLVVPFRNQVPKALRRDLDKEFLAELDALTNYVLTIPDNEVTATLRQLDDESTEVTRETWEYRMRVDSIAAWLNEMVIHDLESCEAIGDDKDDTTALFGSYYQFTVKSGGRPKGIKEFSPNLLELCQNILGWTNVEKVKTRTGRFIKGLRLRHPGQDDGISHPIEALYEANAVTDASRHVTASVTDSVTAEVLTVQGCDGCDGSIQLLEKIQEAPTELVTASIKDEIYPSHPSPSITLNQDEASSRHTQESHPDVVTDTTRHASPKTPPKPGMPVRIHCKGSKRDGKTGVVCQALDINTVRVRLDDASLPIELRLLDCPISWLQFL